MFELLLKRLLGPVTARLDEIVAQLDQVLKEQVALRRLVAKCLLPVPPPPVARQTGREENAVLVYKAEFPRKPEPLGDITEQRFVVKTTEDDVVLHDKRYPLDATESEEFKVAQGKAVRLSMTYIDDAGNESQPSTQDFVAADTIPPDAPGPFLAVPLLREEPDTPVA